MRTSPASFVPLFVPLSFPSCAVPRARRGAVFGGGFPALAGSFLLRVLLPILMAVAGCGGSKGAGPSGPPADACPWIPHGCPGTEHDGCPERSFDLDDKCGFGPKDEGAIAGAIKELMTDGRVGRLRLVTSRKDCAAAVATKLVAGGVEAGRIETKIVAGNAYLYWEVAEWGGEICR